MTDDDDLDPFSPENLRLSQDFNEVVPVKKLLETVPVGRFNKQDFFRIRPEPEYRLDVGLLELKEERESYVVAPSLQSELADEFDPATLFVGINRKGVIRIIPVKLPRDDRRGKNEWASSLRSGVERAMTQWVRVTPNMSLGAYEIAVALNGLPDPVWPDVSMRELLKIALKGGGLIDRADHPVILQLRGLA